MNAPTRVAEGSALAMLDSPDAMPLAPVSNQALILDPDHLKHMMAVAELMATARSTVPKHLQGNKGDCLAVVMQAVRWRMDPFAVAQKTHLVNGTLGYEGQLVNAVVQTMAPTKDRFHYEWFGDWSKVMGKFKEVTSKKKVNEDTGEPLTYRMPDWSIKDEAGLGIRIHATMKGENEPRVLELLLVQCRTRNSPLWADDPRQQIGYLAVKRWTRLYCPDVLLGVYTPDELRVPRDMGDADEVTESTIKVPPELVRAAKDAAGKGAASYQAYWRACNERERALLQASGAHEECKDLAVAADRSRTVESGGAPPPPPPAPTPAPPAPAPAPQAGPAPAPTPAPATQQAGPAGIAVTFDTLKAQLNAAAGNEDRINVAADLIQHIADDAQQLVLRELAADLRSKCL